MSGRGALIGTKLHRPPMTSDHVPREHLLRRLLGGDRPPLVLLSAPAGFGKSTLVSAWLAACGSPSAWLSLDEADDDPATFLAYLVAAIESAYPGSARATRAMLGTTALPPTRLLAGGLANDLDALEPSLILVLDDYHTIRSRAVHALLTELLRHPPRLVQWVIATRHDPPLPLAGLRARRQMVELRSHDLRFSEAETAMLARRVVGHAIDDATVRRLNKQTEGWPAGVRLAALSLSQPTDVDRGSTGTGATDRFLMDYLFSEILDRQPDAIQQFLIKTSILNRLTGPLCDAVLDIEPAAEPGDAILRKLEDMGLFVVSLDDQRKWFRYHQLFQQLLLHELDRRFPSAVIAALYRRASAWFTGHGWVEEALRTARRGGDVAGAVNIVAQHRHAAIAQGDWQRLERWVHPFAPAEVEASADLLLCRAWLALDRLRQAEVVDCVDRAEAAIADLADPAAARCLAGEVQVLRAYEHFWAGDMSGLIGRCRQALAMIPEHAWSLRIEAVQFMITAHRIQGDLAGAQSVIDEAMTVEAYRSRDAQVRLLLADSVLAWMAGNLSGAAASAAQVLAWGEAVARAEDTGLAGYILGGVLLHRNELAAAEPHLAGVYAQRYDMPVWVVVQTGFALALTLSAQGRHVEARGVANAIPSFLREMNSAGRLPAARAFQAELALRQGRLAVASRWADQSAPLAVFDMPFYFVPQLTRVKVRLAEGTPPQLREAAALLAELRRYVISTSNVRVLIEVRALEAAVLDAQGDRSGALAALEEALRLAEPGGFIRLFVDLGPRIGDLLVQLGARGVAPDYVGRILAALVEGSPVAEPIHQARLIEPLTHRELEVLAGLQQRLSNKEIAQKLVISHETVKRHALHIYQKLQVAGRRQAVAKAIALGLLPPT